MKASGETTVGEVQAGRAGTGRYALALWALLAGIYLLTTGGHTYASDEEAMFTMAESLWYHGNFAVEQGPPLHYSQYNPGQPAAALPLLALGRMLLVFFPPEAQNWLLRAVFSWFNPLVTAGIAAAIFYTIIRLGYTRRVAIGTALFYGLGTLAWPHSKTFFAEPFTALGLLLGFLLLVIGDSADAKANSVHSHFLLFLLSGVFSGAAMLVKIHAAIMLPALALYALIAGWRYQGWKKLMPAVAWGCGAALSLGVLALIQWRAFGNPLHTGYGGGTGEFLDGHFSPGLYGLTLSPGKSVLWYSPVLLLLPLALGHFWRCNWRAAFTCVLIVVTNILFYAQIFVWHGDGAWGPRYLNMMLPFAALPLAGFLATLRGRATPWRLTALVVAIVLCIPVQIGALSINFNTYIGMQRDADKRYFLPRGSPIVQHLMMAGQRLDQLYEVKLAPNRLVLGDGWSYSEGKRSAGEQFPRWTTSDATLRARTSGAPVVVSLTIDGCRPAPVPPARVVVRAEATTLLDATFCPQRSLRLTLPPNVDTLTISADAWEPHSAGIDRDGRLGVRVVRVGAQAGDNELKVAGSLVPIRPMPTGFVSLRNWFGDPRYNQWDFWWYYIQHTNLPTGPLILFATFWAGIAFTLIVWGSATLVRAETRDSRRETGDAKQRSHEPRPPVASPSETRDRRRETT